jgi:hypothetical protein
MNLPELYSNHPIEFADGIPQVDHLPHDEITLGGDLYMRRYWLTPIGVSPSMRFHQIMLSDIGTDLHDHPWDFTSVILHGTYIETTRHGDTTFTAPAVIFRNAETLHRLTLPNGPVWTLVTTDKVRRRWGFQTDQGWVHWTAH